MFENISTCLNNIYESTIRKSSQFHREKKSEKKYFLLFLYVSKAAGDVPEADTVLFIRLKRLFTDPKQNKKQKEKRPR